MECGGVLKSWILQCISLPQDEFFNRLVLKIDDYFLTVNSNGGVITSQHLKNKNKAKGDLFEYMCLVLIKNNAFKQINCQEAYLFKDIPNEYREKFGFKNKDMGIDIIVRTTSDEWLAVQCKYKKKPKSSRAPNGMYINHQVPWKTLSTFYSLCERTGPTGPIDRTGGWRKHVVMTTAESISRQGRSRNDKDLSICLGTFRGLNKEEWFKFIGDNGHTLCDTKKEELYEVQVDLNELRMKRLALYEKK